MRHLHFPSPGWLARLAALPLLATLGGCGTDVFFPAGDIALQERNLILVSTALMLLIIVPVLVLIVLFAWRYRKGGGAPYDPDFDHSTQLELVIWACPLLIIICLGAVTWSSTHLLDPFRPIGRISEGRPVPAGLQPLEVQVVAMDWKWLFILPKQGVATVNELALPVDVPVHFSITSTSQMNTFYAPTLAGMIYATPGMQAELNAVLNRTGDSWGYSGNYTGAGYSHMRFQLHGLDQAGFERWIAGVKSDSADLTLDGYATLVTPSVANPVAHFGSVTPGLFQRVLRRCAEPGTACEDAMAQRNPPDKDFGGSGTTAARICAKPIPIVASPAANKSVLSTPKVYSEPTAVPNEVKLDIRQSPTL